MAIPPPPPPGTIPQQPQESSGLGKVLLGCGLGCALVGAAVVALVVIAGLKLQGMAGDMEAQLARMEEASERQREARRRLEALDETHPARLPAAASDASLTSADVDRWLAVHGGMTGPLARHSELTARVEEFETGLENMDDEPSLRDLLALTRGMSGALEAGIEVDLALAEAFTVGVDAIEGQGLGPTELRRLCAVIDWGWLRRDGFDVLALPSEEATALEEARSTVELWADETFDPEYWSTEEIEDVRRQVAESEAVVARLEAVATEAATLRSETVSLLESRRADIEAVPESSARLLLDLLRSPPEPDWEEWEDDELVEGELVAGEVAVGDD